MTSQMGIRERPRHGNANRGELLRILSQVVDFFAEELLGEGVVDVVTDGAAHVLREKEVGGCVGERLGVGEKRPLVGG